MLDHIGPPPRAPLSSAFLLLELYTEQCPGNLAIAFHLRNSDITSISLVLGEGNLKVLRTEAPISLGLG